MRPIPVVLILAVTSSDTTAQGVEFFEMGKQRWVDIHGVRGNRNCRIGWQWGKKVLRQGWKLIGSVYFRKSDVPEPSLHFESRHGRDKFSH